jgi:fumarate reductase flavoprotein subunit
VNADGERFGDESKGYSAFVSDILDQPDRVAYAVTDEAKCELVDEHFGEFEDEFRHYTEGETAADLGEAFGLDPEAMARSVAEYNAAAKGEADDLFGRTERLEALSPPLYGVRVNPAIFHTQGGLVINTNAQVERPDGSVISNLYAGGGSAVGISGTDNHGYSSGNGLLTALGFGRIAGRHARQSL